MTFDHANHIGPNHSADFYKKYTLVHNHADLDIYSTMLVVLFHSPIQHENNKANLNLSSQNFNHFDPPISHLSTCIY